MQRMTLAIDDALARDFDALASRRAYASRSEAVRDLMRDAVSADRADRAEGWCVANLSYVYNHHEREMASRLTAMQHDHHDLVLSTTHVHLSHDDCLETVMLKGDMMKVRGFADRLMAERGVRHGQLNVIPVTPGDDHHHHHGHDHDHVHAGEPHLATR